MTTAAIERPQLYARTAGALYLVVIVLGAFSEGFVLDKLIVSGDAAATAHNIVNAPSLWNFGVAADFVVVLCAVPQMWIEFLLLRPVHQNFALLGLLLNLVSLSVEAVSKLFLMLIMPIVTSPTVRTAFEPKQIEALANLSFRAHDLAFNIALVFFGFTCLVSGTLLYRSGYFPKLVGVMMQLAGISYLVACFAALFAPPLSNVLSPAILLPALLGESTVCLWLLIKGVDQTKWHARQAALNC